MNPPRHRADVPWLPVQWYTQPTLEEAALATDNA
jgi:hypothetical protein